MSRLLALQGRLPVALRRPRLDLAALSSIGRRLGHFWLVWSALLLVHEGGHAVSAWRQGLAVERVTVGMGPVLWRGERGDTELVLRLVPVAGITKLDQPRAAPAPRAPGGPGAWRAWRVQLATLAGGVLATLALAAVITAAVAARERVTRARWVWGRYVIADAVVLTIFNFLPVPPLDGGRAVLGAFAAWHGAPLSGDALFWVQVGGMALAVVPMTLWTRWTARIDAASMRWGASALER
jgi:membrane-associated protease RseP (regulator of RpoE activity)